MKREQQMTATISFPELTATEFCEQASAMCCHSRCMLF